MKLICDNVKCKHYKEPLNYLKEYKKGVFADNRCVIHSQWYKIKKCKLYKKGK